jgi:hypothetical protein
MHTSPPVQVTPHAPQLVESVCVFTHDPLQSTSGDVQLALHAPELHTWVPLQVVLHDPQFCASSCRLTQTPPQSVSP